MNVFVKRTLLCVPLISLYILISCYIPTLGSVIASGCVGWMIGNMAVDIFPKNS